MRRKGADAYVRGLIKANPNMLVPHYLIACFLYYVEDSPLLSDALFDEMSKELLAKWETVEHPDKHRILRDDLVAGTGFAIQYTEQIKGGARSMVQLYGR